MQGLLSSGLHGEQICLRLDSDKNILGSYVTLSTDDGRIPSPASVEQIVRPTLRQLKMQLFSN